MAKFDERYFGGADDQPYDINGLVGEDEEIIWQGKPNKKAFVLNNVLKMLPFALIWLCFDGFFIYMMLANNIFAELGGFAILIVVFFAIHLIPVWIWIHNIVTASARHKNIDYVFTNKRIIIKSGLVGIDINNIYYTEISNVNLRVGIVDKMCGVGDIYIKATSSAQVLWDIDSPYAVVNNLQKIVNDIKTDVHFPNDLRPQDNHGFNTKYKG